MAWDADGVFVPWDSGDNFPDAAPASGAGGLFGQAVSAASSVAQAVMGVQESQLAMQQRRAAIDLQKTYAGAAVDIGRAQAQAAVANAQRQPPATATGWANLDQALANVNSRIGSLSGGNSVMLWLTVAGVAVAILQYRKSRG